jgi:hypothetical protein
MSKVFYNPMKEIDDARDLDNFKKYLIYFDILTKFIRSLK